MRFVPFALCALASTTAASAQQVTLTGPLAVDCVHGNSCGEGRSATEEGAAFTLLGMSGTLFANAHTMTVAPGSRALNHFAPRLDGDGAYLGSGLRGFYQGRHARAGATVGAFVLDRGLTRLDRATPAGQLVRADTSWGGHFDVFVGGQVELQPVFPYLDLVGSLDIVQTRFTAFAGGERVHEPAYNAYLFTLGPRLGVVVPITADVYLDVGVGGGVVGANRFMFTAGFGHTTGRRPANTHGL